ncbi:hypothetical protein [Pseudomonas mucidolens]|nr:hypothetical protein [Pseudomonas mucidolens]
MPSSTDSFGVHGRENIAMTAKELDVLRWAAGGKHGYAEKQNGP